MEKSTTDTKALIQQDIEGIYLGNLKTIEFDLTLPNEGKNGSKIIWQVSDDRWLSPNGKVTRPEFGRGNRIIDLTGFFSLNNEALSKVWKVRILEKSNEIAIKEVPVIRLVKGVGEKFYLPTATAVVNADGSILTLKVIWEKLEQVFETTGNHTVKGNILDRDIVVTAEIIVEENPVIDRQRAQTKTYFPLESIHLNPGSAMKLAEEQRTTFLLSIDPEQMLYSFRKTAGLDTKGASEMIGWDSMDSLLRGHTTGHYLSALSLAVVTTGNPILAERLNYMVSELGKVQACLAEMPGINSGFLSAYNEEQFDLLEECAPYPIIWAPYYTLHKIFAGLLDSYRLTGNKQALKIADQLGDWVYTRLSKLDYEKLQNMWSIYIAGEYGGMNESLAELYSYTKKEEHIIAAKLFNNDRLFVQLEQKIDALGGMHANQHIPQVIGILKIYEVTGEERYYQMAKFFWDSVTRHHIYAMGGTGDGEMFHQPNQIANHLSKNTAETCASYNMLKLTKMLQSVDNDPSYFDYYEGTMINHILATLDHDCGGESTYFMASQPGAQRFFEAENSCCHGTGMENHFKYGEVMTSYDEANIYLNLFVSAELNDQTTGVNLNVEVDELNPETIKISIRHSNGKQLRIRKPAWTNELIFKSVGQEIIVPLVEGYYQVPITIKELEVNASMNYCLKSTPNNQEIRALYYGPYLLVALSEQQDFLVLPLEEELQTKVTKTADGFFKTVDGTVFIPAYRLADEHYHMYFKTK